MTWARPPRVTGLARQKFAWEKNSRVTWDRFTIVPNDICGHRGHRVTRKWNWQVSRPFLTVKSDRGACRFQWRVSPRYCEHSGVTYDLLVSNIGGTYDLANQLPSNHEFGYLFGRKSVLSPSGVRCKPSITVICHQWMTQWRAKFIGVSWNESNENNHRARIAPLSPWTGYSKSVL